MNSYQLRQSVERFHLLFLDQLSRKLDKHLYGVKGGCNLRFFLKSIRYSENMDIDVIQVGVETLRNKVNRIMGSTPLALLLQSNHIKILDVSEPKQTETTQRWKLLLQVSGSDLPINTKIEFSRRNHKMEGVSADVVDPTIISTYQLTPIVASHYDAKAALQQKIMALSGRVQTQSRDVFDIHHLLSMGTQIEKLGDNLQETLSSAIDNALSLKFSDFKGHVLAYLPQDYAATYDSEGLWEAMVLKAVDALQELQA